MVSRNSNWSSVQLITSQICIRTCPATLLHRLPAFYCHLERSFSKMEKVTQVYKDVFKVPELKGARIFNVCQNENGRHRVMVKVKMSHRSLCSKQRIVTAQDFVVEGDDVLSFPAISNDKDIQLMQQGRKHTAYVMKNQVKEKDGQKIVIVGPGTQMSEVDLTGMNLHGKVYTDADLSSLEWSQDETKLVYVAEKKRPKATSFFGSDEKSEGKDAPGTEFLYVSDWGEQMEGQSVGVVCVLDVTSMQVEVFTLPQNLCAGQVVWMDQGLVGVGYKTQPIHLGLIYCPNRESVIFHLDLKGNYTELVGPGHHVRSPRVSPDQKKFVYLRYTVGGPHEKCAQMCIYHLATKQDRVVIDTVPREIKIVEGYAFKGMYGRTIVPQQCWASDNERVLFSSYKLDTVVTYVVNTANGDITELPHVGSHNLLNVYQDWILVHQTTVTQPGQICLAQLPPRKEERSIQLKTVFKIEGPQGMQPHWHSHFNFQNSTPHPKPEYSDIPISVIYFGPTSQTPEEAKRPLICWPHGGPHSIISNSYSSLLAYFVSLGYSIVVPNFRGSLGFGQDGVDSLPGHCGNTDVSDCHEATLACLKRFPDVLDENNVFLMGGSHGGFLSLHLAAQYPAVYKALVVRNPACDVSGMTTATDIPDWTYVESGEAYRIGKIPNVESLSKMYEISPLRHIDNLKAPSLFLIGKNDKRCPPFLGMNFHKMLLARGVETRLHLYDDCHPLLEVEVEADSMVNAALWYSKYRTN
ncbi:acylamino-acid-releasing enzyme-like isoform X2 [Oratosquilla oratoria]|uniref:acylamino-acid-releasing enzyme-like isoform X2 n=1 Tax=Oratosquilla oratoria TaxID=337810 RepID=UPI003F769D11